ncbi:DUF4190 domain-containing protein [Xylanimonas ulmi]|uniref:DUF4190 domain-containing protein n=1 Tax=Xylanimonas ulmi TaxID=228973 RepID=A0A4Q7M2U9_9MICO|nr:DUF4190 domain-containing protein [Xylanibacterium ulmi]RZS61814.1 hypothetical protein EV386_2125 [Xylanibacterium ulmi]
MSASLTPTPSPLPAPPAAARPTGNALATAGFVVGLVALALCLVPIVNNVAFVLGALGLVFGIVGLLKARKGAGRRGLAIAAIVLSVLAGAGVIASQAFYGKVLDGVSDALDTRPTPDAAAPGAGDEDAAQDASDADSEDVAGDDGAAPEAGTRANPLPAGTTVSTADWQVTVGTPREAWGEISQANPFNQPPADGTQYWIVPLSGTFTGSDPATPWIDLSVAFVGDDSVTYDDTSCGVLPDSLSDIGELYQGAQFSGNACVVVPADAPGLFTLRTGLFDSPVFFSK